jgi:hypothetical protein
MKFQKVLFNIHQVQIKLNQQEVVFFEKRLVFHFKTFIMSSFEYHPMARSDSCASVLVTVFFFRLMKRSYRAEISGAAGWNWQWQGATTERDTWQKNGPY